VIHDCELLATINQYYIARRLCRCMQNPHLVIPLNEGTIYYMCTYNVVCAPIMVSYCVENTLAFSIVLYYLSFLVLANFRFFVSVQVISLSPAAVAVRVI